MHWTNNVKYVAVINLNSHMSFLIIMKRHSGTLILLILYLTVHLFYNILLEYAVFSDIQPFIVEFLANWKVNDDKILSQCFML